MQVYVGDLESSVERPRKELGAFTKVELEPGEKKMVSLTLPERASSFYDVKTKSWKLETGEFAIHVGSSSEDIRMTEKIGF